jgi:hypothetical protein
MLSRDGRLQIRDQVTGALRAQSDAPVLSPSGFTSSMVAVDSLGRIFHNNVGAFPLQCGSGRSC